MAPQLGTLATGCTAFPKAGKADEFTTAIDDAEDDAAEEDETTTRGAVEEEKLATGSVSKSLAVDEDAEETGEATCGTGGTAYGIEGTAYGSSGAAS